MINFGEGKAYKSYVTEGELAADVNVQKQRESSLQRFLGAGFEGKTAQKYTQRREAAGIVPTVRFGG